MTDPIRPVAALALALALALPAATATGAQEAAAADPGAAQTEARAAEQGLFVTAGFAAMAPGSRAVFRHARTTAPGDTRLPAIVDGSAEIALGLDDDGVRETRVSLRSAGRTRPVPPFPADAGHPLLLIFLETNVRNMAAMTGGNPHYIRNRLREALWLGGTAEAVAFSVEGSEVAAEELSFRPFATDPNRAEMGAFAELEMRFVLTEAVPGRIASFVAETGPGTTGAPELIETMVFDRLEEED